MDQAPCGGVGEERSEVVDVGGVEEVVEHASDEDEDIGCW